MDVTMSGVWGTCMYVYVNRVRLVSSISPIKLQRYPIVGKSFYSNQ